MRLLPALTLAALTTACADQALDSEAPILDDDGSELMLTVDHTETQLILFVANTASQTELDIDARLDSRAATNIVAARPFDTLAELDEVKYVGDRALGKLRDYAEANPVDVFGVTEGSLMAEAILDLANTAGVATLDVDVALDSRAANNIVSTRASGDFYSLGELDEVSYVASRAFGKLVDYVDSDGDGVPVGYDCDDGDASISLLGDAASCPAASCADVLFVHPDAGDGSYYLEDTDGSTYVATCDMTTDGGGWTVITGEMLDQQDWIAFSVEAGSPSTAAGGSWTSTEGEFLLIPENTDNAAGTFSCEGVAVRATATLPFTFSEWSGSFVADEELSSDHADDVITGADWGESIDDCGGYFKFGTDQDDSKSGGEWGWNWAPNTWTFSAQSVSDTDVIRWETMDSFLAEGALVTDISIKVR